MSNKDQLHASLDALGQKIAAARSELDFKKGLNDGHNLTSGELQARYKYLKSALDDEITDEENHGHHVKALEQDVIAWLNNIDLAI